MPLTYLQQCPCNAFADLLEKRGQVQIMVYRQAIQAKAYALPLQGLVCKVE